MKLFANGVTNAALAKLLSLEFLGGAVVSVFLVGVLWANINGAIAEAQEAAVSNKSTLDVVQKEVSAIKTEVALIRQSQIYYQKAEQREEEENSQELRDIKCMLMDLAADRRPGRND